MTDLFLQNLRGYILGDKLVSFYVAALFFSSLGSMVSIYYSSKRRNKVNPTTPDNFSVLFLVWDNAKRFFVSLIVLFLLFRFTPDMSMFYSVGLGIVISVALDRLIEVLMKKTDFLNFLEMNREKFPVIPGNMKDKE